MHRLTEIKAGKEKLMQSAQKLFAKVYEQAQGAAGRRCLIQEHGAGPNQRDRHRKDFDGDDVVDGDYKEV